MYPRRFLGRRHLWFVFPPLPQRQMSRVHPLLLKASFAAPPWAPAPSVAPGPWLRKWSEGFRPPVRVTSAVAVALPSAESNICASPRGPILCFRAEVQSVMVKIPLLLRAGAHSWKVGLFTLDFEIQEDAAVPPSPSPPQFSPIPPAPPSSSRSPFAVGCPVLLSWGRRLAFASRYVASNPERLPFSFTEERGSRASSFSRERRLQRLPNQRRERGVCMCFLCVCMAGKKRLMGWKGEDANSRKRQQFGVYGCCHPYQVCFKDGLGKSLTEFMPPRKWALFIIFTVLALADLEPEKAVTCAHSCTPEYQCQCVITYLLV